MRKITDNPYPGSRAFTQADKEFFFGRDADAAVIVDLWMTNRLTVVSGPAGCGKTSLLQAAVRPLLREQTAQHRPVYFPAGDLSHGMTFPVPALTEHNPFTLALLRAWAPDDVPTRLAGLSVSDFVRERMRAHGDLTAYAAVDALDDAALGPPAGAWLIWRQEFLDGLAQAIFDNPRLHLLLVTRTAGLSLLTNSVGVGARHTITGLTPQGAIAAVAKPALAAGRTFAGKAAHGIVADLVDTAAGAHSPSGGLVQPSLVQAVCSRLWEDLPLSTTEISDRTIREFGNGDAALARYCGQAIGQTAALHGMSHQELHQWLISSFITGHGTRGGRHADPATARQMPDAVLRDLLDLHLLTSEIDDSVPYYRLLSPRLIRPLRTPRAAAAAAVAVAAELSVASLLRAGELALARGDLDIARAHAQRACDARPEREFRDGPGFRERAEAESLLGNAAYRSGEPAAALRHYRHASELMEAAGDSRAAAYQFAAVGQLLLAGDEPGNAIPELSAAADRARGDLGLQVQLALALWQTGDGRGAVMILNSVLDRDGGLVEARRVRGEILADLGEGDKAISDLNHATPGVPSSQAARGLALAETGDHASAAAEIKDALANARRSGLVLLYAARASDLAGDKVSAKERAREAIDATDPPLSGPHKELARTLTGQGKKRSGL